MVGVSLYRFFRLELLRELSKVKVSRDRRPGEFLQQPAIAALLALLTTFPKSLAAAQTESDDWCPNRHRAKRSAARARTSRPRRPRCTAGRAARRWRQS